MGYKTSERQPCFQGIYHYLQPVKVVFCDSYNASSTIYKRKGEAFSMHISAVDQVGNPVNATVYSTVITASGVGRLKEGQTKTIVSTECAELKLVQPVGCT